MKDEEPGNEELALLTVGQRLREARLAKGLSLDDIGNATRISLRHLKSLEDDRHSEMPGRTYTIGFARAYAKVVDLPEQSWIGALREELDHNQVERQSVDFPDSNIEDSGKVPSRKTAWIIAGIGIFALVIGYVAWRSTAGFTTSPDIASSIGLDDTASSTNIEDSEGESVEATDSDTDNGPVAEDASESSTVIFTATEDRIWVKFYDANGDQLMQKEMALGETYTVPADADGPQLATARPDALSITIDGRVIPALGTAEKVIRDVPVDPISLSNRSETTEQN